MERIDKIKYNNVEYDIGYRVPNNAGAHNSLYRGNDITELFYNGTLSKQIAAGTFDDIFIGDYIIGKNSGIKYLVADINYRLHYGDTEITTPHILMIPETVIGLGTCMNETATTEGAYVGSYMYTTGLSSAKNIITTDFGTEHILKHRNYFAKVGSTTNYETTGAWVDSDIDLMNELMVYGSVVAHNIKYDGGSTFPMMYMQDNSQLSIFRLRRDLIIAKNTSNARVAYWLRDVVDGTRFAAVNNRGSTNYNGAKTTNGVRPAFLVY